MSNKLHLRQSAGHFSVELKNWNLPKFWETKCFVQCKLSKPRYAKLKPRIQNAVLVTIWKIRFNVEIVFHIVAADRPTQKLFQCGNFVAHRPHFESVVETKSYPSMLWVLRRMNILRIRKVIFSHIQKENAAVYLWMDGVLFLLYLL